MKGIENKRKRMEVETGTQTIVRFCAGCVSYCHAGEPAWQRNAWSLWNNQNPHRF